MFLFVKHHCKEQLIISLKKSNIRSYQIKNIPGIIADPGSGGGVMTRPIYIFWNTVYNRKFILAGSALIIKIRVVVCPVGRL